MKQTFRTKWEDNEIACICTLKKKCIHAKACEELELKLNTYDGIKECMSHRRYRKENGVTKQK